jgi:hypothetical protein
MKIPPQVNLLHLWIKQILIKIINIFIKIHKNIIILTYKIKRQKQFGQKFNNKHWLELTNSLKSREL